MGDLFDRIIRGDEIALIRFQWGVIGTFAFIYVANLLVKK